MRITFQEIKDIVKEVLEKFAFSEGKDYYVKIKKQNRLHKFYFDPRQNDDAYTEELISKNAITIID